MDGFYGGLGRWSHDSHLSARKMTERDNRILRKENLFKPLVVAAPIDHRTRHWCPFPAILPVY